MENLFQADVKSIKKNCLGTLSVTMKLKGMRKDQEFVTYPINKDSQQITIQSDTRIAVIDPKTGTGKVSKPHASGAYFHHLQMDKLTGFKFNKSDWQQFREYCGLTASSEAGKEENGAVSSDNSGAISIFDL